MKSSILFVMLSISLSTKAQPIVDDFSSGELNNTILNSGETRPFYQTGTSIIGGTRRIHSKINQNPFEQSFQIAIKKELMAITAAYDTRGTIYITYGKNEKDKAVPMNLNLSSYKNLKIAFEAKSTINGIYVMFFTGTSRAVFTKHVQAREGKFVFTIPLKELKKIGPKYTIEDVDSIHFQFDSRSKTGCNMAIDKIWFD